MQMQENEEVIIINQEGLGTARDFRAFWRARIDDEWQERKLREVRVRRREL